MGQTIPSYHGRQRAVDVMQLDLVKDPDVLSGGCCTSTSMLKREWKKTCETADIRRKCEMYMAAVDTPMCQWFEDCDADTNTDTGTLALDDDIDERDGECRWKQSGKGPREDQEAQCAVLSRDECDSGVFRCEWIANDGVLESDDDEIARVPPQSSQSNSQSQSAQFPIAVGVNRTGDDSAILWAVLAMSMLLAVCAVYRCARNVDVDQKLNGLDARDVTSSAVV